MRTLLALVLMSFGVASTCVAQDQWPSYEAGGARLRGYAGGELGAGVCAAPSLSHPCASFGLIPEVGVPVAAVYGMDDHLELELGLAATLGVSDSIGRSGPLRALLGLMGEAGLRWHPSPRDTWYLAGSARFGLQVLTENFVRSYVDPVTHLMVPGQTGELDPRIGASLGAGVLFGAQGAVDLSVRAVVDTGSLGLRVAILVRLG